MTLTLDPARQSVRDRLKALVATIRQNAALDVPENRPGVGWHVAYPTELRSNLSEAIRKWLDRRYVGVYVNRDNTAPLPSHWPWLPRITVKATDKGGLGLWTRWIALGVTAPKTPSSKNPPELRRTASRVRSL